MTEKESESCIGTIEMLRRLAYNIHGVMDVIDADNCEKIIKVLSDIPKYKDAYNKGWDDGAKASYEHLKMCEEEQSGDLISRDAVIDIIHLFFTEEVDKIPTKKTEDGEVYVIHKCQPLFEMNKAICKRIKALPSASPTQNCVGNALDCISRQAVLEMAYDMSEIDGEHFTEPCMVVDVEDIQKLPSVNPQEPKTGHWKRISMDKYSEHAKYWYRCDKCGKDHLGNTDWCPNCGARMIGDNNG